MIEGVGLPRSPETVERHRLAFSDDPVLATALDVGGEYIPDARRGSHVWTPDAWRRCSTQCAATAGKYREFAAR
jgi:glutamate synthase (NADPH/NADH) large chain